MSKEMIRPARTAVYLTALVFLFSLMVNAGLMSRRFVQEVAPVLFMGIFGLSLAFDTAAPSRAFVRIGLPVVAGGASATGIKRAALLRPWLVAFICVSILTLITASTGLTITSYKPVPVLTYHRVGRAPHANYRVPVISPDQFRKQMAFLKAHGYHTVTPRELVDYWEGRPVRLPARPILITFDDGWRDNYRTAYPILKDYGFTAVIFVTTGELNQRAMLRWPEVRKLARAGFTIGLHGHDHLRFGRLSAKERRSQMARSLSDLRRNAGLAATTFSYPYGDGDLDPEVWSDVHGSGIRLAFASHNFGLNVRPPAGLAVRRVLMKGDPILGALTLDVLLW